MTNNNIMRDKKRRDVLKAIGASATTTGGIVIGSGVVAADSCGIPDDEGTFNEKNYEWKDEDNVIERNVPSGMSTEYGIETQTSVVHSESEWFENEERWYHSFYEGAHIVTKNKKSWESDSEFSLAENVNTHKVTINNRWPGTTSLFPTSNPYDVGAVPAPDGSTDSGYGDAAFTVLKFALAAESQWFAVGTLAVNVAAAMINTGKEDDDSSIQEFQWNYSPPDVCEAAHYSHFLISPHVGYAEAKVDVYEYSVADAGNVNNNYSWTIHVDPNPDGGIESISTQSLSVNADQWSDLSKRDKVKYLRQSDNFEEIDKSEMSDSRLQDKAGKGAIFRALNPRVEITGSEGAPQKHSPNYQ